MPPTIPPAIAAVLDFDPGVAVGGSDWPSVAVVGVLEGSEVEVMTLWVLDSPGPSSPGPNPVSVGSGDTVLLVDIESNGISVWACEIAFQILETTLEFFKRGSRSGLCVRQSLEHGWCWKKSGHMNQEPVNPFSEQ